MLFFNRSFLFGIVVLFALTACGGSGSSDDDDDNQAPVAFSNFQSAVVVIGQADFNSSLRNQGSVTPAANTLAGPNFAPAEGSLYIADSGNHRILGFNAIPIISNTSANFVIGQADFVSDLPGTGANTFSRPQAVVSADGKLFVMDTGNKRVLIWNSLPTSNVPANVVVGASDFVTQGSNTPSQTAITSPSGIAVAGGKLIVADLFSHRVLIWNSIPIANNAPADVVLGQTNFTDSASSLSASGLAFPSGIWSDGVRLAIVDQGNNRVLIWNTLPTVHGEAADVVVGQPDFTTRTAGNGPQGLNVPLDVHYNGSRLFVSDLDNNRVLIYNGFPTVNQTSAAVVLGQSTFTNRTRNDDDQDGLEDANPSARTFNEPVGVTTIGNNLFVSDINNNRVLIYRGQ